MQFCVLQCFYISVDNGINTMKQTEDNILQLNIEKTDTSHDTLTTTQKKASNPIYSKLLGLTYKGLTKFDKYKSFSNFNPKDLR